LIAHHKAETTRGVRLSLLLVVSMILAAAAPAATGVATPAPAESKPAAELSTADAILLGTIEGVTEYLPISSTGHLVVANHFLKLESDTPLKSADGTPLWYKKPSLKHPAGEPLTVKLAADTYSVVIQFGAIAAVALLYWAPLLSMVKGLFGQEPAGRKLLVNVIIAFVPAALIGFAVHDWIDENLFSVPAVIVAQIAGAFLMFFAESWRRRHQASEAAVQNELTAKSAAGIGLLQCLALWPGTSRSMTTIVGGYFAGLNPKRAAEFSFILGFVTLSAATLFKSWKSGAAMIQVFGWSHVLIGCVVAAVVAAVCVRFLVTWLTKHGLALFAWYRIVVAAVLAIVFYGHTIF
jgi:undecaprenyl-diphosphatase